MGRGYIGGVNSHVGGSCMTKFGRELHLNASLVHYEHLPQLTRTRIDEGHILARPAALAWCTGSAWRPRSATACLGAVCVPGSASENVKHVCGVEWGTFCVHTHRTAVQLDRVTWESITDVIGHV